MDSFTDYKFSRDMASHVLNPSYHNASLRPTGYTTLRVKNDSLSSESSGHPNSPEYPQISVSGKQNSGSTSDWYVSNQSIASQSYKYTSSENDCSDEEYNMKESEGNDVHRPDVIDMGARANIEVCQVNVEDETDEEMKIHHSDIMDNMDLNTSYSTDDHSLVEGLDYEVIAVYTVNPHSELLDSSSEDDGYTTDKDYSINKYRCRSRSTSRSCRRRSRSRSQSRYRRYLRSDSPYKRKRRSRSRLYQKRRSPSDRRARPKKSDSKSHRPARPEARSKTPVKRFKGNAPSNTAEKKYSKLLTPPLRKLTVSESSDSSSSSSSSSSFSSSSSTSSSSSSSSSYKSRSRNSFKRDRSYKQNYRGYSSEDK